MSTPALVALITGVFIIGMIWLRTRMHYVQRGRGPLRLERVGWVYFAAAAAVLLLGWYVAPALGRRSGSPLLDNPTATRVIWYLATYYVFILVHRLLQSRQVAVFKPVERL
jgi:hypothetical protein